MERSNLLQESSYGKRKGYSRKKKVIKYVESSGNLFRDMGLEDSEELLQKSNLKTAKLKDFDDKDPNFYKEYAKHEKEIDKAYELYFSFIAYLKKKYWSIKRLSCGVDVTITFDKIGRKRKKKIVRYKLCKVFDDSKIFGFKAIQYAEEFVKKHPGIQVVTCDDDFHSTSKIFLIPIMGKKYHGTRLIFIPQISEDKIISLTPNNLSILTARLLQFQIKQDLKNK